VVTLDHLLQKPKCAQPASVGLLRALVYRRHIYNFAFEILWKGALVLRDDHVILVAADGKDFTQGCRLLENIIHMNLVSFPSTSVEEIQRQSFKDLVQDIAEYKDMIVTEKVITENVP